MSNKNSVEVEFCEAQNRASFIPASEAGKFFNCTSDYITKLAREEKITAEKRGRNWFVDRDSVAAFRSRMEVSREKRNNLIRAERLKEKEDFEKRRELESVVRTQAGRKHAVSQTAIILFIGLISGIFGFFTDISPNSQVAGVGQSGYTSYEQLAINFYRLATFSFLNDITGSVETGDERQRADRYPFGGSTSTTTYTSVIIAPDELFTEEKAEGIGELFSDEVEISVDPDNPVTGVVVPIFKNSRGEEYRYLKVPLNTEIP